MTREGRVPRAGLRIAVPAFSGGSFANYLDALAGSGADGVIVGGDCDPMDFAGLLLPGGGDIDPQLYGQSMCAECGTPERPLDELQLEVLERFVESGRPALGICRGLQIINVCFGGTLIQHLSCSARHSRMGAAEDKVHRVRAMEGTVIARCYGSDFSVNSSHHQAVDALGKGLEAVAWSDDGVIEAVRHRSLPVYGVQWHPERMCFERTRKDTVDGAKLFEWFLGTCKE